MNTIHELARTYVNDHQRIGQAYFNAAYDIDSVWANKVRSVNKLDPFYSERNLPAFLTLWFKEHA